MDHLNKLYRCKFLSRVIYREELSSTNDFAKDLVSRGELPELPLLILAERQTRGRGRGRNRWWSAEGAVTMSLVFNPSVFGITRDMSPLFSCSVAFALLRALEKEYTAYRKKWEYHWPNDIDLEGKKVSGMLLESPSPQVSILGVGINVNQSMRTAPEEIRRRSISCRDCFGEEISRTALVLRFLEELEKVLTEISSQPGAIIDGLNRRCMQRDREILLEDHDATFSGRCLGIARDGALLLKTEQGTQSFYSGSTRLLES